MIIIALPIDIRSGIARSFWLPIKNLSMLSLPRRSGRETSQSENICLTLNEGLKNASSHYQKAIAYIWLPLESSHSIFSHQSIVIATGSSAGTLVRSLRCYFTTVQWPQPLPSAIIHFDSTFNETGYLYNISTYGLIHSRSTLR